MNYWKDDSYILKRLKKLISKYPELNLYRPAPDWAAMLCLHYWHDFQRLQFAKGDVSRVLLSPETLLRIARKYDLTPGKVMNSEGRPMESGSLDKFIDDQRPIISHEKAGILRESSQGRQQTPAASSQNLDSSAVS